MKRLYESWVDLDETIVNQHIEMLAEAYGGHQQIIFENELRDGYDTACKMAAEAHEANEQYKHRGRYEDCE